ncbi:DUF805 domain-containing protein [Aurantimonas sp. 22II-16-19i]|uniref:DUF805 domain-containing protein n=1 Tax=Aurantimonas sp. 22II-16-19i TaxID=1317114 RepID=UPI0015937A20|nr:DUF805 domain-containing protein [Aurantimonas sp. 22II-16-19i]
MSRFFSFHGRIGRATWWLGLLFSAGLVGLGFAALLLAANQSGESLLIAVFGVLLIVAQFWIGAATTVCRLHDLDYSGFVALLCLVPVAGTVIMILCAFKAGTPGWNEYGPSRDRSGYGDLGEALEAFDEPAAAAGGSPRLAWPTDTGRPQVRMHPGQKRAKPTGLAQRPVGAMTRACRGRPSGGAAIRPDSAQPRPARRPPPPSPRQRRVTRRLQTVIPTFAQHPVPAGREHLRQDRPPGSGTCEHALPFHLHRSPRLRWHCWSNDNG